MSLMGRMGPFLLGLLVLIKLMGPFLMGLLVLVELMGLFLMGLLVLVGLMGLLGQVILPTKSFLLAPPHHASPQKSR
jgi:hypothetical protein